MRAGPVTIEIKDGKGQSVRKYSSADVPVEANPKRLRIPSYWIRPPQSVSTKAGMHRFLWDMHYTPVPHVEPEFPMTATYRNTAPAATSPWAAPGDYTITLTVDGKTFSQPLTVAMDPRVKASAADLQEQFDLSWQVVSTAAQAGADRQEVRRHRRATNETQSTGRGAT